MRLRVILFAVIIGCFCHAGAQESLIDYVNTMVGTSASTTKTAGVFGKSTEEYGQTLPAVLEPNGMNFWTPQTTDTELKCKAPYYYKDNLLQGFRNSHWIVGGCTQDYGSMTIMPISGTLKCMPEERASNFSHEDEVSRPDYYSVFLKDYGIKAEMTGRSRAAIFRFEYPEDKDAFLVINPNSDEGEGYIQIIPEKKQIRGYNPVHRIYQGKGEAAGFRGYFIIQLQDEIEEFGTYHADEIRSNNLIEKDKVLIGAWLKLRQKSSQVVVKVATSFTGWEGCEKNLEAEIPHWDFDKTHHELKEIWEKHLGKIEIDKSADKLQLRKFYSALYRASFLPHAIDDVDGKYPAFSKGTPIMQMAHGHHYYEDFSMWDTYRALHPLLTILSPSKTSDMMQSLVLKYQQGGWLPIFPCWNSYTAAMIGDHCISVLGDAYIKGIRGFDIEKAYDGMRKNAFEHPSTEEYNNGMGRRALKSYLEYGYIPLEDSVKEAYHKCEQTSRTLEYAYDDYVLAQVAKALGKDKDYKLLLKRASNYRNVIDPKTGYAQGRYANGSFLNENNAFKFSKFITEGAPCHYSWYVPHDVKGLMKVMGGKEIFAAKLDSMFTQQRYWHGNEPCHQIAYLFNYVNQEYKTQKYVRHILDTEYLDEPGGLSGNDDAGQMSAWYLFSALGFYPVCPGKPEYMIGSPVFPCTKIHIENGNTFTIRAINASNENIYIQSIKLNGKNYKNNYLLHEDIMSGGNLEIIMGNKPVIK